MKPLEAREETIPDATENRPTTQSDTRDVLEEVALATPLRLDPPVTATIRSARLVEVGPLDAVIAWRGSDEPVRALVAHEVDRELLRDALKTRTPVLVEREGADTPIVVGLLQTSRPKEVLLAGERVEIRAEREILLRTGRAGIRLRDDGELELVGSRISAVSRGLFRLVGRMLKLN